MVTLLLQLLIQTALAEPGSNYSGSKPQPVYVVAVVDTGLNLDDERFSGRLCRTGHRDFSGTGLSDDNGHGTHVAGLIMKYAENSNYCLLIVKYYSAKLTGKQNADNMIAATIYAVKVGADFVNLSGGGNTSNESERETISKNPGVIFVAATGNEGKNLDGAYYDYYPASYVLSNVYPVMSTDEYHQVSRFSNTTTRAFKEIGENQESLLPCGQVGKQSGTSQAAAIFTGKLVKTKDSFRRYDR